MRRTHVSIPNDCKDIHGAPRAVIESSQLPSMSLTRFEPKTTHRRHLISWLSWYLDDLPRRCGAPPTANTPDIDQTTHVG
jgi:hypothetical protein